MPPCGIVPCIQPDLAVDDEADAVVVVYVEDRGIAAALQSVIDPDIVRTNDR